jgi:hypothetical protein
MLIARLVETAAYVRTVGVLMAICCYSRAAGRPGRYFTARKSVNATKINASEVEITRAQPLPFRRRSTTA